MRALGYATLRYKDAAFCAAGAVARLAGALLATQQHLATPSDAALGTAVLALVAVVIGGRRLALGPCVGAAIVVIVRDETGPSLGGHGPLLLSIVFVVAVYLLPEGIARAAGQAPTPGGRALTALLSLHGVSRSFGGMRAVDDVSLALPQGARHGLIGPNGNGKSTLFKLISGAERVSSGSIRFADEDITSTPEHVRARRGIAQTFQHSQLFARLTCRDNVALAVQRHNGSAARLLPRRRPALARTVADLLERSGLGDRRSDPVSALSHGERRQLEVTIALGCSPRLLLLDEPAAGMSPAETDRLAETIDSLDKDLTVLVIEHDMDFVFRVATTVNVLHLGSLIEYGPADQVRASSEVARVYLGGADRKELFVEATA